MHKIVPKSVQVCFENVLGVIFSKIFYCPLFRGESILRNAFFKIKNFQHSEKAQNRSQIVQTCFEHVLG